MSIVEGHRFEPMIGDPDDHRPRSEWSLVVDPGDDGSGTPVDDLAVVLEHIGPGDGIPLHVHRVNEVIFVHGDGTYRLGTSAGRCGDGSVLFVPAGTPHAIGNDGATPLPIEAVFPATRVWLRYLERNPAPGTEANGPGNALTLDFRTGEVTSD